MADTTEPKAGEQPKNLRQEKVGRVLSTSMNKTVTVEVMRRVSHPLYRREVRLKKKFYAHDETNQCRVGDIVRIVESRPLSRLKRWRLAEIIRRARGVGLPEPSALEPAAGPRPEAGGQS